MSNLDRAGHTRRLRDRSATLLAGIALALLCAACSAGAPEKPAAANAAPSAEARSTQTINPCSGYAGVPDRIVRVEISPDQHVPPGDAKAEPTVEPFVACLDRSKNEQLEWVWVGPTTRPPALRIEFPRLTPFAKSSFTNRSAAPRSGPPSKESHPGRFFTYSIEAQGFGKAFPAVIIVRGG